MLPTQSEAPFVVAQLVVMALFVLLGIFAVKRFHAAPVRGAVAFGLARNSDIRDPPLGILVPRNASALPGAINVGSQAVRRPYCQNYRGAWNSGPS
jgi:hypothetical protein